MAEQSLKDKTVKGVGWSAIDNVSQYAVTFIVGIVLARLLSPDDYGLLGIIAIFTAICNALINGGFGTAIIRKKNVTEEDYNTAFIVNIGMSFLLYLIIYLLSPLIARFFNREELVLLTRVSSIGMILGALTLVPQTRLTKRIDFKTQTKITLIACVVSGVTGIVMALVGCGVWSLVAQGLSSLILRAILYWIYDKWIPQLHFSIKSFNDLFGFGWKMMVSGLIDTVWKEMYQVVVGKFYSPASLGQYTRSKQFAQLFSTNITNVIQRVTFPVLADIQDENKRMVLAYRRIIKISMFFTVISMFFLGAISEPLLYCLIGPKWHEAAVYLPLICLTGSTYPLQAINLNMLQVQGRSDLFLGLEIIKKTIAIGPLLIGVFVGIIPMLYANVFTTIISFFLNSYYSGKLIGYSSWMQIKDVTPSYKAAIIIALSVYFVKYIGVSFWVVLPLQLTICAIIIVVVFKYSGFEEVYEIKNIIKPLLTNFRKHDEKYE